MGEAWPFPYPISRLLPAGALRLTAPTKAVSAFRPIVLKNSYSNLDVVRLAVSLPGTVRNAGANSEATRQTGDTRTFCPGGGVTSLSMDDFLSRKLGHHRLLHPVWYSKKLS